MHRLGACRILLPGHEHDVEANVVFKASGCLCILVCKSPTVLNASMAFQLSFQNFTNGRHANVSTIAVANPPDLGVGICVGPLYSIIPQFLDWISAWEHFAINKVYGYAALYTSEEWAELGINLPYMQPTLYTHHLIDWKVYRPIKGAHYHSQLLLDNDCLYRHRREQDFLVFMDADEIIQIPGTSVRNLHTWLKKTTPPTSAGLCFKVCP